MAEERVCKTNLQFGCPQWQTPNQRKPSMILTESSPSRFQNRSTCFFAIRHPNGIPTSSPGHPARAFSSVRNTEMSDASSAPGFFVQRPSGPRKSRMPESVPFNCALPWNQVQNIAKTKICKNIISYPSLHSILIYSTVCQGLCAD